MQLMQMESYFDEGVNLMDTVQRVLLSEAVTFSAKGQTISYRPPSVENQGAWAVLAAEGQSEALRVHTRLCLLYTSRSRKLLQRNKICKSIRAAERLLCICLPVWRVAGRLRGLEGRRGACPSFFTGQGFNAECCPLQNGRISI